MYVSRNLIASLDISGFREALKPPHEIRTCGQSSPSTGRKHFDKRPNCPRDLFFGDMISGTVIRGVIGTAI
jgi:hypothetical protein